MPTSRRLHHAGMLATRSNRNSMMTFISTRPFVTCAYYSETRIVMVHRQHANRLFSHHFPRFNGFEAYYSESAAVKSSAHMRVRVTFAALVDTHMHVDVSFAAGCDAQWRANVNSTPLLRFAALPTTSFVEPQRSGETEDFYPLFSCLLLFFVAKHHSQHCIPQLGCCHNHSQQQTNRPFTRVLRGLSPTVSMKSWYQLGRRPFGAYMSLTDRHRA